MTHRLTPLLLGLALLASPAAAGDEAAAGASPAVAPEAQKVLDCVRANAPASTMVQTVELITVDRDGAERSQSGRLYLRRMEDGHGRALLRVEAPPDLRGSAILAIQKRDGAEMFLYLPEYRRVRRITSHSLRGKLLGSDITYEELEYLLAYAQSSELELTGEAEVAGRPTWVLEAVPDPVTGSGYVRIVSQVDRETCIPLQIDFYEVKEIPAKVLTCDPEHVSVESGVHVPRHVVMRDVQRGTESRLVTHAVEMDPDIDDRFFSQGQLAKGH